MIDELLKSFITLFVIMDPFGNLPILISLMKGMKEKERTKNIYRAVLVASILLFIFLFFGVYIFKFFNISINSFIIAGGIILLVVGIQYVLGLRFLKEKSIDIASVPLGTPLLTGPGVITSTIILVNEYGMLITAIAAIATLAATLIILRFSSHIYRLIGEHWSNVLSRIMGLILAAIAVEFIRKGILGALG